MQAYEGYFEDGRFTPIGASARITGRRRVIMTVLDEPVPEEPKPLKRPLGFLKDKVPPLPDSFFDPLPEEDLQAWGL
jgi:hypothetical protein